MKKSLVAAAVFLAASAMAAVAQSTDGPTQAGPVAAPVSVPGLQQHNPRYQLHKDDVFEVDFAFSPEFNQTVTVQPDGYVALREVGSLHVEGETVPELTDTLKQAYAGILHDPSVAIVLKDFDKPFFIASGEVSKPGRYDIRGPLTVTQAIAIAGGFNEHSKTSQVVLFHPTNNGMFEAKLIDVKKLLDSRNLNEDIALQPGDLVYVPESKISKIRRFWPNTALGAYYNPSNY